MTDLQQTTGQCNRCKGEVYYDGLNWHHRANDRGLRECPPTDPRPSVDAAARALLCLIGKGPDKQFPFPNDDYQAAVGVVEALTQHIKEQG